MERVQSRNYRKDIRYTTASTVFLGLWLDFLDLGLEAFICMDRFSVSC